jgi:hypothetical protein
MNTYLYRLDTDGCQANVAIRTGYHSHLALIESHHDRNIFNSKLALTYTGGET